MGKVKASNASSALWHASTTCHFVVTGVLHAHWFNSQVVFVVSGNTTF